MCTIKTSNYVFSCGHNQLMHCLHEDIVAVGPCCFFKALSKLRFNDSIIVSDAYV